MMLKQAILILSLFALVACATPQANYVPQVSYVSLPPVNTVSQVGLGEFMLQQGYYSETDSIRVSQDIQVGGMIASYTIGSGIYLKQGNSERYEYYRIGGAPNAGVVTKSALADPFQTVAVSRDSQICVVSVFNAAICDSSENFSREKTQAIDLQRFQQILIYNGRSGNTISIGYRELSNNVARPAFSNEVTYDLNESMIIGYQSARIRILEATNTFIRYEVLENFNQTGL